LGLSKYGLHALMPLLLFWVIAGLRAAFAFPVDLKAGWIFRITGASTGDAAAAARRWMQGSAGIVMFGILAVLAMAHWDLRHLLIQLVCGLCLCSFLVDAFFGLYRGVPFNQPRMPGRTSLPLMLTLYLGLFPLFILGVVSAEIYWEKHLLKLTLPIVAVAAFHALVKSLQSGPDEVPEEMEGYEEEFQILGLS